MKVLNNILKFYSNISAFKTLLEPKNQKNADMKLYILKKVIEFNYMKTEFYRVLKPQEAKSIIEIIPKMRHKRHSKPRYTRGCASKNFLTFQNMQNGLTTRVSS